MVPQAQCGDAATEKKIEEKIDLFLSWVEKHPNKKSQVLLNNLFSAFQLPHDNLMESRMMTSVTWKIHV